MLRVMTEENSLWKGSSSQWLNLGPFTAALLAAAGILVGSLFFPPAAIALALLQGLCPSRGYPYRRVGGVLVTCGLQTRSLALLISCSLALSLFRACSFSLARARALSG